MKKTTGFTLLELLIALSISSMVILLLFSAALMVNKAVRRQSETIALQHSLMVAEHWLGQAINTAGYFGCKSAAYRDEKASLVLSEHELTTHRMDPNTTQLLSQQNATWQLLVAAGNNFKVNQQVMVASCDAAEVVTLSKVGVRKGNQLLTLSTPLKFIYSDMTEVGQYEVLRFFVRDNSWGESALYMEDSRGRNSELVSGIKEITFSRISSKLVKLVITAEVRGVAKSLIVFEKIKNA